MIIASALSNGTSTPGLVEQVQLLILLLIVTLIVALLARLMRVPYTLLLVIVGFLVGIVVGLMPFLPHEHLDPNLVLYIFIPALLFEGAWNAELDRLERSEEHTSELQSRQYLVCRLLLEKKNTLYKANCST